MVESEQEQDGKQKTFPIQPLIIILVVFVLAISIYFFRPKTTDTVRKVVWYAAMLEEEWELYKPIIDEFTGATGIEVEVKLYGQDWDKLLEDLSNEVNKGEGIADIVTIDDFLVSQASDYVENLTEEVEEWGEWDELYYGKKSVGMLEGQIFYLPWRADCLTMFINIEKLGEHGLDPPATMEELLTISEALFEVEGTPKIGMKAKKYEGLTTEIAIFIKAYGGDYLTLNTPQNKEAFEFLQDLSGYLHPDSKTWDEGNIPDAIINEEIYINFNWPYQVSLIANEGLDEKIIAYPNPLGTSGRGTTMGGGFLGISNAAPHKGDALTFLMFLVSKKGQGLQLDHLGWLPVRDDAWNYLEVINPARYTDLFAYRTTLKFGLARPAIDKYPELTTLWQDAFWEIVWEGNPVEETLNKYQDIWETK